MEPDLETKEIRKKAIKLSKEILTHYISDRSKKSYGEKEREAINNALQLFYTSILNRITECESTMIKYNLEMNTKLAKVIELLRSDSE